MHRRQTHRTSSRACATVALFINVTSQTTIAVRSFTSTRMVSWAKISLNPPTPTNLLTDKDDYTTRLIITVNSVHLSINSPKSSFTLSVSILIRRSNAKRKVIQTLNRDKTTSWLTFMLRCKNALSKKKRKKRCCHCVADTLKGGTKLRRQAFNE